MLRWNKIAPWSPSYFITDVSFLSPLYKKHAVSSGITMSQKFFFSLNYISYAPCKSKVKSPLALFLAFILYLFKLQFSHYRKLDSKDWNLSPLIDSEQRLEDKGPVKQRCGDPVVKYAEISRTAEHQVCVPHATVSHRIIVQSPGLLNGAVQLAEITTNWSVQVKGCLWTHREHTPTSKV